MHGWGLEVQRCECSRVALVIAVAICVSYKCILEYTTLRTTDPSHLADVTVVPMSVEIYIQQNLTYTWAWMNYCILSCMVHHPTGM